MHISDATETGETTPGRGLDRRTLIKRAAIVGGTAWAAPVIIDSLASPAGAVTGGLRWQYTGSGGSTCTFVASPTNSTNSCDPLNWSTNANGTALPQIVGTNTISVTTCAGKNSMVFGISGAGPCVFTGGSYDNAGGTCEAGVISGAGKVLTIDPTVETNGGNYRLTVTC